MQYINDSVQTKARLLAVEAKLKDWASLIPSCLDVTKEGQGRRRMTSYNCESAVKLSWLSLDLTVRLPPLVILLSPGSPLSCSHASFDARSQVETRFQPPKVVSRGAASV